jgi:nucleoside-specific outer membrane channel protein Tsx
MSKTWAGSKKARLVAVAIAATLVGGTAHAFEWSDTTIGYRWGPNFKEPGVDGGRDVPKNIFNVSHADGYKYGTNFFSIDVLLSPDWDPAVGNGNMRPGALEFYGVFRTVLSGNKISGTKAYSFGPVADVGLEIGADFNSKNTTFASEKKLLVVGPQFAIALPKGFWTLGFHAAHEWNYNGIVSRPVDFDWTFEFETAWAYPFALGPVPVTFEGFLNVVAPKGKDGFGADTQTELLAHPKLMVDVGKMVADVPQKFEMGVGFEYWLNKFGNDHNKVVGSEAKTVFIEADYHF